MRGTGQVESVIVVGAGVAGLFATMMLAGEGRAITILERDPAPPDVAAGGPELDAAFEAWRRPGVGQLRHSHAFLARLINIVRDRHPVLLERLKAAGCREVPLSELVPSSLKSRFAEEPGDADMSILMSRRTTFELVVRRYVESLPGVTFRPHVFVKHLLFGDVADPPTALGVATESGEQILADVVIDAAGRWTLAPDWLSDAGAALDETGEPAGIKYYTRHWRLKAGQARPPRSPSPGAGDMGFLKFGLFEADNGWFSVSLAAPDVEVELQQALVRPGVFDAACRAIPGIAPWIAAERAEPQTKVFAMGELRSKWRRMVRDGRPVALGLFLIGDSLIQSNPLYGRGATFAAVEADALARALSAGRDATGRAILYDSLVEQALRPFYDDMQDQDRSAIRRSVAEHAGRPPTLRQQILRSLVRDGAGVALRDDPATFRAALRAFHMIDPPRAWMREPRHLGVVFKAWARGKKRNAHLYPGRMGPSRAELLGVLDLSPPRDLAA